MKEWRVILVLLAIAILLGAILGVKIVNNTPEKQQENNINETVVITDVNEYIESTKGVIALGKVILIVRSLVLVALVVIAIIGIWKLCIKLSISPNLLRTFMIVLAGFVISLVVMNVYKIQHPFLYKTPVVLNILFFGFMTLTALTGIMLISQFLTALDIRFMWAVLLIIFPYILCFIIAFFNQELSKKLEILIKIGTEILTIMIGIRLADTFNKGIIYKIGLCIFPLTFVFMPILGFTAEE